MLQPSVEYAFVQMYPEGPIMVEDIMALYPNLTRQAVYKKIKRALEEGNLKRYCQGVYYVPKEGLIGEYGPLAVEVVQRKWLSNGDDVFGYYANTSLENQLGMTSQVPACLEITTNKERSVKREVEPFGGWRKIILYKPRMEITAENVNALKFLDLITCMGSFNISEYRMEKLRNLARMSPRKLIYECAQNYPAQTAKKLVECEVRNVLAS